MGQNYPLAGGCASGGFPILIIRAPYFIYEFCQWIWFFLHWYREY